MTHENSTHPQRLEFLKSHGDLQKLVNILSSASSPESLLLSTSTSNASNILHFIVQSAPSSASLTQFLEYISQTFPRSTLLHLFRAKNTQHYTPIRKFCDLHKCKDSLVFSMERDLRHLERLYKDMRDLQTFMQEHELLETGTSEQAVRLLEVKNTFIKEKNELLQKVQQNSQGEPLELLKTLNVMMQHAYGLRLVLRRDSSCCLRLAGCTNESVRAFYSKYDEVLNSRYANRMLQLLDKPPKDVTENERNVEALLRDLEVNETQYSQVQDSWKRDTSFTSALQLLLQSEEISGEEFNDPQKLIDLLVEKRMLKQVFLPQVGCLVAYCDHAMHVKYLARLDTIPLEEDIDVCGWLDGQELHHKLTTTPNILWQNIVFYKGDMQQIRFFFRKQQEQKVTSKTKASKESNAAPKGMTDEEERKLNSTMEEVQRLLDEARNSLQKMET